MVDARHPGELFMLIAQEQGERLVVVEFFAPDCPACKALFPKFIQIAENNPQVNFKNFSSLFLFSSPIFLLILT